MATDGEIVLDRKDQHASFRFGNASYRARQLIVQPATIARLLLGRQSVKQRWAIERLAFVLAE